jgi:hypothetical protein
MAASRRRALAALTAALVIPAACNGDDTPGYAERVNDVCTQVERELRELETTRVETRRERAALIDDVIAAARQAVRRLEAIEPPGVDDGETAERFVRTLEREIEDEAVPALEDLRDAVTRGDVVAADAAAARLRGLERSDSERYARELGANACAG